MLRAKIVVAKKCGFRKTKEEYPLPICENKYVGKPFSIEIGGIKYCIVEDGKICKRPVNISYKDATLYNLIVTSKDPESLFS